MTRLLVVVLLAWSTVTHAETMISVGSGEPDGVYYPVAQAICAAVNRGLPASDLRCSPEATPGSGYNLEALRSGDLDMAIVQSDLLAAAHDGTGLFAGHPFPALRTVALLHRETVTVIVRADSTIHGLADLAGRQVNIGSAASGTRIIWDLLSKEYGDKPPTAAELRPQAAVDALCRGRIDASLMIVGHPSPQVTAYFAACTVTLLPLDGPIAAAVLKAAPYYGATRIPGAPYGLEADIPSFGGRAVLATTTKLNTQTVGTVARALRASLPELRNAHPALGSLDIDPPSVIDMPAPLHPGAATPIAANAR